jgi:hypothetical protein
LKKSGLKIVIFVPEQAYEDVKRDFENNNIVVEAVHVNWKRNLFQRIYYFISTYLIFTEGSKLFASKGIRLDIPVAGGRKYTYYLKLVIAGTLGKSNVVKNYIMPKFDSFVYRERPYKNLFNKYKPDLVFLPDVHSIQDVTVLREAKRQKIKTIGMPGSWDHFPKRFEPLRVDKLMVWNEVIKKEAIELQNYDSKNVFITGAPYYDIFTKNEFLLSREDFFNKFNLNQNKKLIFYSSGSKYAPDDGDVVDIILKSIKENKFNKSAQIFLRPYPGVKFDHDKFDKFNNEDLIYVDWIKPKKIFGHSGHSWYPTIDSIFHFYNTLYHSDIIVNTYSSVSVEASALLKPIININFDGYKNRPFEQSIKRFRQLSHYKNVMDTEGVKNVSNAVDLINTLNNFINDPSCNYVNTKELCDKMCWKVDGKSSERIANHILNFIP